jgi:hypothetical protein
MGLGTVPDDRRVRIVDGMAKRKEGMKCLEGSMPSATWPTEIPTQNSRRLIPDLCSKSLATTHMNSTSRQVASSFPDDVIGIFH